MPDSLLIFSHRQKRCARILGRVGIECQAREQGAGYLLKSKEGRKKRQQVNAPIIRPAIAYPFFRSLNRPMALNTMASGTATMERIPDRNPMEDPHPKPGTRAIALTVETKSMIQGVRASQKPILPVRQHVVLSSMGAQYGQTFSVSQKC